MLEYKCQWYGSTLVVVDPAHTSETCSECEAFDAASRITHDRFVCTDCHKLLDADVKAASSPLE